MFKHLMRIKQNVQHRQQNI